MSIENKLTYLEGTKTAIKDAIVSKGVAIDDNATFRSYATAISTIETGGGTEINNQTKTVEINQNGQTTVSYDEGYTGLESVVINTNVPTGSGNCTLNVCFDDLYIEAKQNVEDKIQYTINLQNNYTSTTTYQFDKEIYFAPNIDLSGRKDVSKLFSNSNVTVLPSTYDFSSATDASKLFLNCYRLTKIPTYDFSNVTNLDSCFINCSVLVEIGGLNLNNVTILSGTFKNCNSLYTLDLTSWNTSKVTNFSEFIGGCNNLKQIKGYLDIMSASDKFTGFYLAGYSNIENLRQMAFKNIGYASNATTFDIANAKNWGVNSDTITEAKQSLIDSLITYSFDRATAGYSSCTLKLAANTKAVLTEEEIAQITAKNYTIA